MKQIFQRIYQVLTISFAFAMLLIGCRQEVTRKADWETHFTDLYFADPKYGWIVGEKGFIVHTNNGGKTWNRQEVGTGEDLKAVYFTNLKYGWAVGDNGVIAATDDGGRHWYLQKSHTSGMLRDVCLR